MAFQKSTSSLLPMPTTAVDLKGWATTIFSGMSPLVLYWILGRYLPIIAPLPLLVCWPIKIHSESPGTLRTDSYTFGVMTLVVIIIVTALSYLPALALGPIAEYFSLY